MPPPACRLGGGASKLAAYLDTPVHRILTPCTGPPAGFDRAGTRRRATRGMRARGFTGSNFAHFTRSPSSGPSSASTISVTCLLRFSSRATSLVARPALQSRQPTPVVRLGGFVDPAHRSRSSGGGAGVGCGGPPGHRDHPVTPISVHQRFKPPSQHRPSLTLRPRPPAPPAGRPRPSSPTCSASRRGTRRTARRASGRRGRCASRV